MLTVARTRRIPKLTRHKASGRAVVRLGGKDLYCGKFGTTEAQKRYHQAVVRWLAEDSQANTDRPLETIAELTRAYLKHVHREYTKRGRKTSTVHNTTSAVRHVLKLYAGEPIEEFGPLALKAVRASMIDAGWARTHINAAIGDVRRMFAWAGESELIDPTHPHRLACVKGLRRGQGGRETSKVAPVAWSRVKAVEPYVAPQVWAMIEMQWLTGMRPEEVTSVRTIDIETDGAIWFYSPAGHKTEHHDKDRAIAIGPKGQKVLTPWLRKDLEAFLFQPAEAEAARNARRTDQRQMELYHRPKSHQPAYRRVRKARTPPGGKYSTDTYRRAIARACARIWPPPEEISVDPEAAKAWRDEHRWAPNRLRHSYGTRVRKTFGLDAARAALGHSDANVTLDYAELDRQKAAEAAKKLG